MSSFNFLDIVTNVAKAVPSLLGGGSEEKGFASSPASRKQLEQQTKAIAGMAATAKQTAAKNLADASKSQ